MMGLIRRSFSYLSCYLFRKLYLAFVRPHLEYAQVVWAPYSKKLVNMIENVQIRATKMIDGLGAFDYPERSRKLNLPIMVHRRARGAMIELYKHTSMSTQEILFRNHSNRVNARLESITVSCSRKFRRMVFVAYNQTSSIIGP